MSIIPNLTPFFHLFDRWMNYIYQMDVVFGFIIVLTALLLSIYSYKVYNFTKNRNYLLFCISFLFIALGYCVKTGIDLLVSIESLEKNLFFGEIGFPLLMKSALLLYMVLILIGYIIMTVIVMKGNRKTALLFLLLLIVSLFISQNYFLTFNLTAIVLLAFLAYHFYRNFDEIRSLNAGIVWFGFMLILLSHLVIIFMLFSNKFYLLSNLFLISGFLLLLVNYLLVLKK
jgi:hypothetical protein